MIFLSGSSSYSKNSKLEFHEWRSLIANKFINGYNSDSDSILLNLI